MNARRASLLLNVVLSIVLAAVAGLWLVRRSGAKAPDYWTTRHLEAKRDLYDKLELPPHAVVLLGDSLTERGEWRELLRRDDVYGRGISGDTAAGLRARLGDVGKARPKLVALMVGINDLEAGVAPAAVAAEVGALIDELAAASPGTRVLVQSVLPMRDVGYGVTVRPEQVEELNALLAERCRERGAVFVDLWPALTDGQRALAAEHTLDGIHLTGSGYQRWAERLSVELR